MTQYEFQFEWDRDKTRYNEEKHGIAFQRAATVFLDPSALSIFDDEQSENEERWITLGFDKTGSLLVICHTITHRSRFNIGVRLISARKPRSPNNVNIRA